MANQIPIKVLKDGSDNTCGLAQFSATDTLAVAIGGTGLTTQGVCAFAQPGINAVACKSTYIGICAAKSEGAADENTYVGYAAGQNVTTGCYHTIIGSNAGDAITTCSGAVLIGYNAGTAITFGDFNTLIGTAAGAAVVTASNNTAIGYHAATATICSNNVAIGTCALVANTQGQGNIAIGLKAGATQVAAGCNNIFIGSSAGAVSLCRDNIMIGNNAGIAATTGGGNIMIGACVGYGVVGGDGNVYIGDKAGLANTSGNDNVFIGKCAGCASTASCTLVIGNGTCDLITGAFNTPSLQINAALTVGVNDTGHDVKLFGASAGAFMLYDESADTLDVRGATAAGPGVLKLTTGELTNVDGGILGRLEFQAPLDSAGTDAILVAASIWAEADATFSATVNTTDLVFATATSATATEKLRLTSTGVLKINSAYCMPTADGSAGYFLCTDGSGALSFAALTSSPWSTSGCFITVPNGCFVGVGTATPDRTLHVFTATAGSVTPDATADDLVVENSGPGGLTIAVPDASAARIVFQSPSSTATADQFLWNYNSGTENLQLYIDNTLSMKWEGGTVTKPGTPAFLTCQTTAQSNLTGDGTFATVDFGTEVFDQGGNLSGSTFTAPVAGRYQFTVHLRPQGLLSGHTAGFIYMRTSNNNYQPWFGNPYAWASVGEVEMASTMILDMDAADTAYVQIYVAGSTKVVDLPFGAQVTFSGYLIA